MIGGLVASGIGHSSSSLESWCLLFLVLGAVTSGYAIFLFFLLPHSPATASFLTPEERIIAAQRINIRNNADTESAQFQWSRIWDAAGDLQAWLLAFYTFYVNLYNGGISSFGAIIIAGFGYSNLKSLLIQMPMGAG
ncbi:allantoate permease [Penicillium odoratum]|uniref:allantoate permease n=1 Tax=Penicillium odoratum TaxID=1167516 RepID=UPI00254970BF|nr:allantoate permease [Penicillium odoratum]KAJ5776814.1 allantoate permease [Penicillium odoratum]